MSAGPVITVRALGQVLGNGVREGQLSPLVGTGSMGQRASSALCDSVILSCGDWRMSVMGKIGQAGISMDNAGWGELSRDLMRGV